MYLCWISRSETQLFVSSRAKYIKYVMCGNHNIICTVVLAHCNFAEWYSKNETTLGGGLTQRASNKVWTARNASEHPLRSTYQNGAAPLQKDFYTIFVCGGKKKKRVQTAVHIYYADPYVALQHLQPNQKPYQKALLTTLKEQITAYKTCTSDSCRAAAGELVY